MGRATVLPVGVVAAVLLALYVALISAITWVELIVGASVAMATAAVGALAMRVPELRLDVPRLRWRWLLTFPADAGWDAVRLAGRLGGLARTQREQRGWWDVVSLPDDVGDPGATRAYAVLVVSLTPASYVADVEIDEEDADDVGRLRVRRWARKGPVERVISP